MEFEALWLMAFGIAERLSLDYYVGNICHGHKQSIHLTAKSWDMWRRPVIAASARSVYCGMVSEGASTELGRL